VILFLVLVVGIIRNVETISSDHSKHSKNGKRGSLFVLNEKRSSVSTEFGYGRDDLEVSYQNHGMIFVMGHRNDAGKEQGSVNNI
jgi:hypothetical protein